MYIHTLHYTFFLYVHRAGRWREVSRVPMAGTRRPALSSAYTVVARGSSGVRSSKSHVSPIIPSNRVPSETIIEVRKRTRVVMQMSFAIKSTVRVATFGFFSPARPLLLATVAPCSFSNASIRVHLHLREDLPRERFVDYLVDNRNGNDHVDEFRDQVRRDGRELVRVCRVPLSFNDRGAVPEFRRQYVT